MRWSHPEKLPNIKNTLDRYQILPRIINRNRVKINAAGSPCTYWRNASILALAKVPVENIDKCYCWSDPTATGDDDAQQTQPDRRHFLCHGTGYLPGYQKYGYTEIVLSTPSTFTKSSNDLIISGSRGSAYVLSGTSQTATLTSERFTLNNLIEFGHFLVNESIDADQNKIEYYYSLNDTDWIEIDIDDYNESEIANKSGTFTLAEGTDYIRFRITLRKRYSNSTTPKWNSLRFRYRNQPTLGEIDPRFSDITTPAFLAAREQETRTVEATEYGWTIKYPLNWWTLPEADIQNADVISFLKGTYQGYRFETKNLREFTYGEDLQILHKAFESVMIRDEHALLGIIHYLI